MGSIQQFVYSSSVSIYLRQSYSSFEQSIAPSHTQAFGIHWLFEHLNSPALHVLLTDLRHVLSSSSSPIEQSYSILNWGKKMLYKFDNKFFIQLVDFFQFTHLESITKVGGIDAFSIQT